MSEVATRGDLLDASQSSLIYDVRWMGGLNYALANSRIPFIDNITIQNNLSQAIEGLKVTIAFDYDVVDDWEQTIEHLPSGEVIDLSPQLTVHAKGIFELSESLSDCMTIRFTVADQEVVPAFVRPFVILPMDQWTGSRFMPESIASFVMPNLPEIVNLQQRAAQILKKLSGDASFSGYQMGSKNHVRQQLAAIYSAIYEQQIVYVTPPTSFMSIGQRVRTPQQVLEQKMGTCLDMATLFASVAEACGLNPFIVLIKGHAFAGAWLEENFFDINYMTDYAELMKRLADGINDVEIVECTAMNHGKHKTFEQACRRARGHLEDPDRFDGVIDVRRSHYLGLLPLPVKRVEAGQLKVVDYGLAEDALDKGVTLKNVEEYFLDTSQVAALEKSDLWMRNLLDLSKRNNLISFSLGTKNLQLFNSNLASLEDALAEGDEFELREVVSDWTRPTLNKRIKLEDIENEAEFVDRISQAEFKAHRLRTFSTTADLQKRATALYREARSSQEESGSSSLFLALGFLRWYDAQDRPDADGAISPRYAPLVLVPVEILRKNNGFYRLRLRDEDPQMNITLLEFLKQKYQIVINQLNPLPTDEKGIDLPLVFNSLRKALLGQEGWDVVELAVLGHFSFSQFVMWDDLKRRFDRLTENKVVKALVTGRFTDYLDSDIEKKDIEQLSQDEAFILPTSADASQVQAILEASRGASFVLHGPPGTGKSQTITNMIANALYQGKTVLFVAEKMAALNVVHERLSKLGIGDFCLEMHSNKTNKSAVLAQFQDNLDLPLPQETGEFKRKTGQLNQLKGEIGAIVSALHQQRGQGYSIYELVNMAEPYRAMAKPFHFSQPLLADYTPDRWDQSEALLHQLVLAGQALTVDVQGHPLSLFRKAGYAIHLRPVLEDKLRQLQDHVRDVLAWQVDLDLILDQGQRQTLLEMMALIRQRNLRTRLDAEGWQLLRNPDLMQRLDDLVVAHQALDDSKAALLRDYQGDILTLDWQDVKRQLLEAESSLFWMKNKRLKQAMMPLFQRAKSDYTLDSEVAKRDLDRLGQYQDDQAKVDREMETLLTLFKLEASQQLDCFDSLEDLYVLGQLIQARDNQDKQDSLFALYQLQLQWESDAPGSSSNQLDRLSQLEALGSEVAELTGIHWPLDLTRQQLTDFLTASEQWMRHLDLWKEWSSFYLSLESLEQAGLGEIVAQVWHLWEADQSFDFQWDQLLDLYRASLLEALIQDYMAQTPCLARFSGVTLENRLHTFKRYVEDYERLAVGQIHQRLASQLPNPKTLSNEEARQLANLKHIIQAKGRATSIRRLFQDNGAIIRRLTPCLLMSPLSVAQYIDMDYPKFDLVIFDEASQIRTSVAVGAMSRGENCVIVGDPKQMPPTSFFNQQVFDDQYAHLEDLESLLDDCLGVNMPELSLDCHYRSQSESLIRFSNEHYYHNKMRTFPAPGDRQSSLHFHLVKGCYSGQTNRPEAEAIVETVIQRLKDPALRQYSMGVVTFNQKQQELIEDCLQARLSQDSDLEPILSELSEPIFVKNLENVQGDERDIILFSITYGPDEEGKVYQRFGPINQKNGWRRLNVATSRSRVAMMVFSSMEPDEIRIGPSSSEGVRGLKAFLEMARKGRLVTGRPESGQHQALIQEVASALEGKGYQVDCQIGASDFKVSLAVVHPYQADRYLMAILLDDQSYAAIPTVHDRERLIPSVLERMGWNLYRLWTLDWYTDPKRELEKIGLYLNQLIAALPEEERIPLQRSEGVTLAEITPTEEVSPLPNQEWGRSEVATTTDRETSPSLDQVAEDSEEGQLPLLSPESGLLKAEALIQEADMWEPSGDSERQRLFSEATPTPCQAAIQSQDYPPVMQQALLWEELADNLPALVELAGRIVAMEAPIDEELLFRRLAAQFKDVRLSKTLREQFALAIKKAKFKKTKTQGHTIYWGEWDPQAYPGVRLPTSTYRRELEWVPMIELANASVLALASVAE